MTLHKVISHILSSRRNLHTKMFESRLKFNQPLSPNEMQRSGGIASFMRLPLQETAEGLDACFVGIPIDSGASNRPGTRFGPRQIRSESVLLRPVNQGTGAMPFESLQIADIGDVAANIYNIQEACNQIKKFYEEIVRHKCIPLSLGGDHTFTYPVLQAMKTHHGPVALIHVDAHADVTDEMMGSKIAHGTPFKRAMDENLIIPEKTFQIGLRGPGYLEKIYGWSREQGFHVIPAEECWHKSLTPLMEKVKKLLGDSSVYLSFDIDSIDPAFCPGTGTPEIAGLTTIQALEIIRGCRGMKLVGCDLVEVSPPYDPFGTTALVGANLLFEMLCVLPGVKYMQT